MKIFGINIGRKKKLRPKKQKKVEPAIPPLTYSASFFEPKNETEKIKERKDDSSELQEIILPEKSKVDIDDDSEIGFVPEQEIYSIKEEFTDDKSIPQIIEEKLSPEINDAAKLVTEIIEPEKSALQLNNDFEIKSKERDLLLEEINSLSKKIQEFKFQSENFDKIIKDKQETVNQLENRINDLTLEIDSKIEDKKNLLNKLNAEIEQKTNDLNNLIEEKQSELNSLIQEIEIKSGEFQKLEDQSKSYLTQTEAELTEKIQALKSESEDLEKIISEKNEKITELETQINKLSSELESKLEAKKTELVKLEEEIKFKQDESKRINENNAALIIQTEKQLKDKILELDSIINYKNNEILRLDSELKDLIENFELKKSEIQNWEEQNRIHQETIQKSKDEIAALEMRVIEVHSEAKELLNTKNEIYSEILKLQEELTELKSEKEKTVELIQLSQKRRDEIEFSNDQLEKRLLRMIQKFDNEIKELSNHKTNIEKKISELENKVVENENVINEKLNLLKETEDKLRLRQTELNSINNLISNLNEKEDLLSKSISNYEKEISSKRSDNQELRKDIDLLTQKKSAIEKILEELFITSEKRIGRLRETHLKTESEIRDKELLYEELNQKIDKAIDELVELQKSVHAHKIELEDLEIKSENLKKINESLEREIENNNRVLEQFKKMKESISDNSADIRKDFSREFGINKDDFDSDSNQKKIFRL